MVNDLASKKSSKITKYKGIDIFGRVFDSDELFLNEKGFSISHKWDLGYGIDLYMEEYNVVGVILAEDFDAACMTLFALIPEKLDGIAITNAMLSEEEIKIKDLRFPTWGVELALSVTTRSVDIMITGAERNILALKGPRYGAVVAPKIEEDEIDQEVAGDGDPKRDETDSD